MLEAHFGVPMAGAVLNTLNTRLDAAAIAFILEHSETKVLIVDRQWSEVAKAALSKLKTPPLVVDIDDPYADSGELIGACDYENSSSAAMPATRASGPRTSSMRSR